MTNKELQDLLKQYPDDMLIGAIESDPDHPEQWTVVRWVGVLEMRLGYMGRETEEKCLVIN